LKKASNLPEKRICPENQSNVDNKVPQQGARGGASKGKGTAELKLTFGRGKESKSWKGTSFQVGTKKKIRREKRETVFARTAGFTLGGKRGE